MFDSDNNLLKTRSTKQQNATLQVNGLPKQVIWHGAPSYHSSRFFLLLVSSVYAAMGSLSTR